MAVGWSAAQSRRDWCLAAAVIFTAVQRVTAARQRRKAKSSAEWREEPEQKLPAELLPF